MTEVARLRVEDVVFRDDLYPRIEKNPVTVQQYAEVIEKLPPIEVNQRNELIDGWHRWTAHKKVGAADVPAVVTRTSSDAEFLELAIARNAAFGLQLSRDDKMAMARRIYHETLPRDRDAKKARLAEILSVTDRTIRNWLSRIDKDTKEEQRREVALRWFACFTQEEISEATGVPRTTVRDWLRDFGENGKLSEIAKILPFESDPDFTPPIYNVWKSKTKTDDRTHFGNTETTFLDNLLWLHTKPLGVVVDPFAGSGSTADVCLKRGRRYFVSDRLIQPEYEGRIRRHDLITDGIPSVPWSDVNLVYLDPPYWRQAEGKYSNDPEDLANQTLEEFTLNLTNIITGFSNRLKASKNPGAVIAVVIQPTQWKAPNREFVDHVADLIKRVNLPILMRYQAPYESQQATAQMVNWAKETRTSLVLSREIIAWRTE